jgi:serine/threonine-protein kinase
VKKPVRKETRIIEEKRRNPVTIIIPLIAVILAIGFMVWLISNLFDLFNPVGQNGGNGGTFAVEDYLGKKYSDVRTMLFQKGIDASEIRVYSDVEEGLIIKQSVPRGTKLATDRTATIEFEVSDGIRKIMVPSYKNKEYREVEADLKAKGLRPELAEEVNDTVAKNYVTRTDPEEGTELVAGAKITVYRSLGPDISQPTVPYLIGMSYNEARRAIEEKGFRIGLTFPDEQIRSDETVINQSPVAGTPVDVGVSIDLWFGALEETPTPTPEETETPTPTPTPEPTPTPTPEQPTSPTSAYVEKPIRLFLPPDKEYDGSVRVLVEVTPSDTGILNRQINRRMLLDVWPYDWNSCSPSGGTTLVTVYYEGEFIYEEVMRPDD